MQSIMSSIFFYFSFVLFHLTLFWHSQAQYSTEFVRYQTDITSTSQVNCHALCACADITSISHATASNALQCSGVRSCTLAASVVCYYITRANGYMSLAGSGNTLISFAQIDCWGEASCIKFNRTQITLLECSGLNSCKNTISSTTYASQYILEINSYAMFSLQNSLIQVTYDPSPTSIFEYNFYGWHSGFNSSIYCNKSCAINCYQNGCQFLNVYCLNTNGDYTNNNSEIEGISSCNITCNEGIGHKCPNSYGSGSVSAGENLFREDAYSIGNYDILENYYYREYKLYDLYDNATCEDNSDYTSCNDYQDSNCRATTLTINAGTVLNNFCAFFFVCDCPLFAVYMLLLSFVIVFCCFVVVSPQKIPLFRFYCSLLA